MMSMLCTTATSVVSVNSAGIRRFWVAWVKLDHSRFIEKGVLTLEEFWDTHTICSREEFSGYCGDLES